MNEINDSLVKSEAEKGEYPGVPRQFAELMKLQGIEFGSTQFFLFLEEYNAKLRSEYPDTRPGRGNEKIEVIDDDVL